MLPSWQGHTCWTLLCLLACVGGGREVECECVGGGREVECECVSGERDVEFECVDVRE